MLNTQLSKVYFDEALKEAAQARADRKVQIRSGARNNRNGLFFLLVLTPVLFWVLQSIFAG